jgi:hypothetical protein
MNTSLPRDPASRPGEPTEAAPGSPTKIRVLTERASRREALLHPRDNLKRQPLSREADEPAEALELEQELELEVDLAS